jgi:hypothetical protein
VLCTCGSGKTFERCHGDSANAFAREQALAEARQIAWLFPAVRTDAPALLAFADDAAGGLEAVDDVGDDVLADGLTRLDDREKRRLVDSWSGEYPDRWASLTRAAGDVAAAECELVLGVISAAIHERLATPHELLVGLEVIDPTPSVALAAVLPPPFLWSYDEARAAAAALPWQLEEVSLALGRMEHVERLRRVATFVERELPFEGLPETTAAISDACRLVDSDVEFARGVLALALMGYAHELNARSAASRN